MDELHNFKSNLRNRWHGSRRNLVIGAVVALLVALFLGWLVQTTLFGKGSHSSESEDVIAANVQTLKELEQQTVPDVASLTAKEGSSEAAGESDTNEDDTGEGDAENVSDDADDETAEQQKIMTMADPDKSTLLEWFNGCAIVGDSFVAGLSEAQFLDSSIVYGKIGISVYGSDDLIASMETVYPKKVFLSFGLNDMSHYGENVEKFIENYRPRIEKICSDLPDADVYLIAVLPVREDVITNGYTKMAYSDLYNERLEEFASEMGVGYLDPWFILEQDPSYYGSDGMHVNNNFYYKWLTYLADETGLSS